MKEFFSMNKPFKKYLPIYMIMLSIVLLMGTSYALLRSSHQGENTYTMNVGTLQVTFVDSATNALTLENAYPMTDDEGMSETKELTFTVKNTGTVTSKYSVYIEETSTSPEFKSVIRYISNKNNTGYNSPKTLASDKYIDSESSLGVSATATYKVKAWISDVADSTYMNKTFTARIVVDATQYTTTSVACFNYQDVTFYKYKENMTDDEVAACVTYIESRVSLKEGDTYENFCRNKILDNNNIISIKDFFAYNGYATFSNETLVESFTTKIEGIEITGYYGYENADETNKACPKDIIMPNSIDNKPVIYITDLNSFEEGSSYAHFDVTSVVLPDTLMEIGDNTFLNAKFKTIDFPNSLEVINKNSFKGGSLEGELVVSGGVKTIINGAFADNKITKLTLGDSVKFIYSDSIDGTPFENNQLTEIKVGNGISAINEGTFLKTSTSNPNLSKITFNKTCSEIKQLPDTGGAFQFYPWLAFEAPYTATGVTIYGSNNEVCDSF